MVSCQELKVTGSRGSFRRTGVKTTGLRRLNWDASQHGRENEPALSGLMAA